MFGMFQIGRRTLYIFLPWILLVAGLALKVEQ